MPTKSQILGANPHTVLDLVDGWKTTVAALERHAETYLGYVQRPGGSTWEGRTAEAAQARARQDYVAVSRVGDTVDTAARQISNTISSTLMPPLANAKQIIENADASPGVHVNEDLSISYTPPQGTSKETADANTKTVADAEAELKSEAAKWWAAELDVGQQIRDAESTVVKDLNFGAALYDPHRAMPTSPKVGQPPGTQQAVFPPVPTQTPSGEPSGLGDLLGAGKGEPVGGAPGLQEMLFPGTGPGVPGKRDSAHQPGSLTEMLNQLSQPHTASAHPPVPIPQADVEAFKAMARDLLRRDGVPPDQIEQRLNTFVTRAHEGYGLMGNRVPQPESRGPGPGFGDGFADTWFGFQDMVHNLTGQGGPGAPGVLESWAGLAEGAAEAIVKPPIAGIVEDALNSPNPAYFLGGKTAEAAITAPSMMFGPEALAARGGLVEAEGAGGFGATGGLHLPHETPPIANGPHLPHGAPPVPQHGPAELAPHGGAQTAAGELPGHPPQGVGAHPSARADTELPRHASPAPAVVPAPAGGGYQAPGHLPDGGGGHGGAADHHVTSPDHPHTPGPDHHPAPPEGPSGHSGHPGTGAYQPPEPATFDPGIADHYQYNSGDPLFPGDYPPRVPEPTFTRGDTEPGWAHINRGPDREWMPYQGQISGTERPPSGYLPEYVEINPETGSPVDYDGHTYRGPQEVFLEAKDGFRGMAFQPDNSYWLSRAEGAFGQAQRQLDALPEGAILEWHVSDPYGAAALRQLFERRRLFDVTVIYTPKL